MTSLQCTSYCSPTSLFEDLFLGLSKRNISRINFYIEFSLNWRILLPERFWKKTSEQSFVNAVSNIGMLQMNSMIFQKPLLNVRDRGWETAKKWLKGTRKLSDIVKVRDSEVWDNDPIYKGSKWECRRNQLKSVP